MAEIVFQPETPGRVTFKEKDNRWINKKFLLLRGIFSFKFGSGGWI
jgi:hypothetical protein